MASTSKLRYLFLITHGVIRVGLKEEEAGSIFTKKCVILNVSALNLTTASKTLCNDITSDALNQNCKRYLAIAIFWKRPEEDYEDLNLSRERTSFTRRI